MIEYSKFQIGRIALRPTVGVESCLQDSTPVFADTSFKAYYRTGEEYRNR